MRRKGTEVKEPGPSSRFTNARKLGQQALAVHSAGRLSHSVGGYPNTPSIHEELDRWTLAQGR